MRFLTSTALATAAIFAVIAPTDARVWTSGKYTIEAEYVATEDGVVCLRTPDGKNVIIPRQKLSKADIEFIEREFEANPFKVVEESPSKPTRGGDRPEAKRDGDRPVAAAEADPTKMTPGKQAGERKVLTLNGVEFAFRWCPAGEFSMGSPASEYERENDEVQHTVTFPVGFWILETEVTQAQWKAIFPENPSRFKDDNRPVECVTWGDCVEFCEKLSKEWGIRVQLPTEARWEYACRAGSLTPFSFGSALNGDKAVCDGEEPYGMVNPGRKTNGTMHVKTKQPNAWGLYDMHGNVAEWCRDWYSRRLGTEAATDPVGPAGGRERVIRGGGWDSDPDDCRSAAREEDEPNERDDEVGFRFIIL